MISQKNTPWKDPEEVFTSFVGEGGMSAAKTPQILIYNV
jgi:hypothetical protein